MQKNERELIEKGMKPNEEDEASRPDMNEWPEFPIPDRMRIAIAGATGATGREIV